MSIKLHSIDDYAAAQHYARVRQKPASLALEAGKILFIQLKQRTSQLEMMLLEYSANKVHFNIDIALGEICDIIDISHRIYALYPLMNWRFKPEHQKRIDAVAAFHQAFENLPSAIVNSFSSTGNTESVLGDFTWAYRSSIDQRIKLGICRGGHIRYGDQATVRMKIKTVELLTNLGRFDGHIGIFAIDYRYIKANAKTGADNEPAFEVASILLDDIIEDFNDIIQGVDRGYATLLAASLRSDPEASPKVPGIEPSILEIAPD